MGLNAAARLRLGGVEIKKGDALHAPIGDIWAPPKGHPLEHLRFRDPVNREMVEDIKAHGVREPITVREDPLPGGKRRLLLVDGGNRTRDGLVAQEEMGAVLYVPIRLFTGTDAEVLLERVRANADPLKRPDTVSVLARTIAQMAKLGPLDVRAVAAAMPRGVGPAEVTALVRWPDLVPELRPRFDSGELPIGLLGAVLDSPRDEQVQRAEALKAQGIRSTRGATRKVNGERDKADPWARRMSPRQAVKVADALAGTIIPTHLKSDRVKYLAEGVEQGIRIAAGQDVVGVLDLLPKPIADAIRKARKGAR